MGAEDYPARNWAVNHGNWTSFYSRDTDVNDIETVLDNISTTVTHEYKRFYHFTKECVETSEGNFWPDKMLTLSGFRLLYPIFCRGEMRKILREGVLGFCVIKSMEYVRGKLLFWHSETSAGTTF